MIFKDKEKDALVIESHQQTCSEGSLTIGRRQEVDHCRPTRIIKMGHWCLSMKTTCCLSFDPLTVKLSLCGLWQKTRTKVRNALEKMYVATVKKLNFSTVSASWQSSKQAGLEIIIIKKQEK
jgi:hypothetical protein